MIHIGKAIIFNFSTKNKNFLLKLKNEMASLERIMSNNSTAEELLKSLKSELSAIRNEKIIRQKHQLRDENAKLLNQVNMAKEQLIKLENTNGKKQIPLPGNDEPINVASITSPSTVQRVANITDETSLQAKPAKEKKPKKEKPIPAAGQQKPISTEPPVDVGRLDMRVGKIIQVDRHPDADSLYLEKIDCGEAQPRTVVSGLVKFVPIDEMRNRMVIVLCNLKPAKMRGITSEAMVMCASSPEKVEVLSPPAGVVPGDLVHCDGFERQPDAQMNPKKKIFETVAPDLMINNDLIACYKGSPLHVPEKGVIVAQTLRNVNVK